MAWVVSPPPPSSACDNRDKSESRVNWIVGYCVSLCVSLTRWTPLPPALGMTCILEQAKPRAKRENPRSCRPHRGRTGIPKIEGNDFDSAGVGYLAGGIQWGFSMSGGVFEWPIRPANN